eukprot:211663-Pelagomonas_calceolata.AAC.1
MQLASEKARKRAKWDLEGCQPCCNGTSLVPVKREIRCEHGRGAQEAIRMGCKSPRSAIKE